jgi:hypothetical protein
MTLILIIFCIWGASALVRAAKANRQQRELERIKAEQQRQRAERQEQIRQHNEEARQRAEQQRELMRLAKAEREQAEWNRKQEAAAEREHWERIAADAKLEKEQEKLAKRVELLESKVRQLDRNIEAQDELLNDYYAQLDWLLLQQSGTTSGSAEFAKWQNKIVTKNNQIRKAECKLADMKDAKERAERELAA